MDKQVNASHDIVEASLAGFIERRDTRISPTKPRGDVPLAMLPGVPGSGSTPAPPP
jgi:hypothetical protein